MYTQEPAVLYNGFDSQVDGKERDTLCPRKQYKSVPSKDPTILTCLSDSPIKIFEKLTEDEFNKVSRANYQPSKFSGPCRKKQKLAADTDLNNMPPSKNSIADPLEWSEPVDDGMPTAASSVVAMVVCAPYVSARRTAISVMAFPFALPSGR